MKRYLVIVNPAAQGGRSAGRWLELEHHLSAAGLDFEAALTSRPEEATELAKEAVGAGRPVVVAAGGDGTVNEVVNGFQAAGEGGSKLGVIPLGTGGDFRRTHGIPSELGAAVALLQRGFSRRIDIGLATFTDERGGRSSRFFVNIADAGIAGQVMLRVNRSSKRLGGTATYMLASALTVVSYRNKPMSVAVDGERIEVVAQQVVAANGRFYGAGMKIAPYAQPDDGLLDVLVVGDVGLVENVRGLTRIRAGRHLEGVDEKYVYRRARRVQVESRDHVLVDVDGENLGHCPAVFEIVPAAIELIC